MSCPQIELSGQLTPHSPCLGHPPKDLSKSYLWKVLEMSSTDGLACITVMYEVPVAEPERTDNGWMSETGAYLQNPWPLKWVQGRNYSFPFLDGVFG